jgi:hypothetical protein
MSESTQQMGERFCGVIAAARFEALPQPYGWQLVSQLSQLPTTALARPRWLGLVRADARLTQCPGRLSHPGVSFRRRFECFGFRRMARGTHEERGGDRRYGGVRL